MTIFEIILCVFIYILMGFFITELWELWSDPYYWNYSIWVGIFWPVTVPIIILFWFIVIVSALIQLLCDLVKRMVKCFKKKSVTAGEVL